MSWPASVILTWGEYEELKGANDQPLIEEINSWIEENWEEQLRDEFHALPEEFANGRICGENIYFGGFNYFAPDELLYHLRELNWQEPENVQLFVRDMEDATFQMFTLNDFKQDEDAQKAVVHSAESGQFAGQLFAFVGELQLLSHAQWSEIIEQGGGHVTYAVSKRTTGVIGGDIDSENGAQEVDDAHRLGIPVIWEDDFHAALNKSL